MGSLNHIQTAVPECATIAGFDDTNLNNRITQTLGLKEAKLYVDNHRGCID